MHVHALDAKDLKAGCLYLILEGADSIPLPHIAGQRAVQRGDHALYPRHLADILERHRVIACAEPSHAKFHRVTSINLSALFVCRS